MGLADIFSGGADSAALHAIETGQSAIAGVNTPTSQQLTLPQLRQYVQAGIMTPEQAQAYLVNSNAFDSTTADNAGLQTELSTIGSLQDIINKGGQDAQEQSDIGKILADLNTTESGNNAAIDREANARGVGNSGFTLASKLASNQNQATNANANALGAAANAEARQIAAMNAAGGLGGAVQGQEYAQESNKANAANAIAEFNANQKQQVGNLNTTESNAAQAANLANAQDVSNKNTETAQEQERSIPAAQQQAFEDALAKASAQMGGASNLANANLNVGQQNAGILGGLIGTAGTVGAASAGNPYAALSGAMIKGGGTPNANLSTASTTPEPYGANGGHVVPGGIQAPTMNMKSGGPVPGMPMVPGDSPQNDTQLAKLSPGEIVLPRSVTQPTPDPNKVMDFLRSLPKPQARPSIHPKAVLDTMRALSAHHQGA